MKNLNSSTKSLDYQGMAGNGNLLENENEEFETVDNSLSFESYRFLKLLKKFKNRVDRVKIKLINNFLQKAEKCQLNLENFEDEVLAIFERALSLSNDSRKSGCDLVREVSTHDPEVIFGVKPRKHPLEKLFEDQNRVKLLQETLKHHLFNRAEDAWMLLKGFGLSMMTTARSSIPVLLGPPAGGKSFLPQVLTQALQEIGLKVEFLLINAGVDRGDNDELEMKLLGIDVHWSTASPGEIYTLSRNVDFLIVVLDELDKKRDRRFFLELLDTGLPLQDRCIRSVSPKMNLRHKVFFIGTANEYNWEEDRALASRTTIIKFAPYTVEEKLEIVGNILMKNLTISSDQTKRHIIQTLSRLVVDYGMDVREALGLGSVLESLVRNSEDASKEIIEKFLVKLHLKKNKKQTNPMGFLTPNLH